MKKLYITLLALAFCLNGKAQVCFNYTYTSSSAYGPPSVASADFNNDGNADLVYADFSNDRVIITFGTGIGTFTNTIFVSVGTDPAEAITADFNNDGNIDIAVANSNNTNTGTASVCVLLGTGTGTFGSPAYFGAGYEPNSIISADFNGDGKADLAVGDCAYNGVLYILLGTGTGSFGTTLSSTPGCLPVSITSSDFNQDGKADVVLGGGIDIVVLLGNGTGNFLSPTAFSINGNTNNSYATTSDDFNGDGHTDIATVYNNGVWVFLGTGTGSFGSPTNFLGSQNLGSIISKDFNGDGNKDLAAIGVSSNSISLLVGNGTGIFTLAALYSTGGFAGDGSSICSNDFNNDGRPDIKTSNSGTNLFLSCTTPVVSVNTATICIGANTTLTASGADTYTWSTGANGNSIIVSPTVSTSYTVMGSIVGSTKIDTVATTVTVNPAISPTITVNTATICAGGAATLIANGANTYTWNPSNDTGATYNPTPSSTTIYTVSGTVGPCTSLATTTVIVNHVPTYTLSSYASSMCVGTSQTFSITGASSYTWAPAATLLNPNSTTPTASPTTNTTYSVTGSNQCGNGSTWQLPISMYPVTYVYSGGSYPYNYSICSGSSILLSVAYGGSYTGGGSCTWTPMSSLSDPVSNGYTASPTTTTIYTITYTNSNGCISSPLTITVTVDPAIGIIPPTITPEVCGNNLGSFNGALGTGGSGSYSYSWNGGTYQYYSSITNLGAGVYTLTVKDYTSCISSPQSYTLSNISLAPPPITVSSTLACVGGTLILRAPISIDTMYSWLEADSNTGTGSTYTITNIPSSPNPYSVTLTSSYASCTGVAETFTVSVNPSPLVTFTLQADPAPHTWDAYPTYTGGTPPYTYNWSWGDGSNSTTAYPSHVYSVAGTYSICVTITDANGCSSTYCQNDAVSRLGNNNPYSSMVYINVDSTQNYTTGINKLKNNNEVTIYPNPANTIINIALRQAQGDAQYTLYDINGRAVKQSVIYNSQSIIDISDLNKGVYNISIQSSDFRINKRVVIVR